MGQLSHVVKRVMHSIVLFHSKRLLSYRCEITGYKDRVGMGKTSLELEYILQMNIQCIVPSKIELKFSSFRTFFRQYICLCQKSVFCKKKNAS